MAVLDGVTIDRDGGVGARSFAALPAAAGGRYNIVSISLLGSESV
jgi:hypothetical protein